MTEAIRQLIVRELEMKTLHGLEEMSERWLYHEYKTNLMESEKEYNERKEFVIPFLVDAKLKYYEEEYL